MSFYLDFLGTVFVLGTALMLVGDTSIKGSSAGLAISNSIRLLVFFSLLVREFNEISSEVHAVKVCNLCYLSLLPHVSFACSCIGVTLKLYCREWRLISKEQFLKKTLTCLALFLLLGLTPARSSTLFLSFL